MSEGLPEEPFLFKKLGLYFSLRGADTGTPITGLRAPGRYQPMREASNSSFFFFFRIAIRCPPGLEARTTVEAAPSTRDLSLLQSWLAPLY